MLVFVYCSLALRLHPSRLHSERGQEGKGSAPVPGNNQDSCQLVYLPLADGKHSYGGLLQERKGIWALLDRPGLGSVLFSCMPLASDIMGQILGFPVSEMGIPVVLTFELLGYLAGL